MSSAAPTGRTKIRRMPARGVYEREKVEAILDEALVAHLGFVQDGQPYVIPTLHARVDDLLYIHGSAASRTIRTLAGGAPVCLTATLLDGLVLARSAMHHSVNYRSVVVLGTATPVEGPDERRRALEAFTERLVPGRWSEVRPPSDQELKGVRVLAIRLDEASAKVRTGPPLDDSDDYALPVWAGVVPLEITCGEPIPDPQLGTDTEMPAAVSGWRPLRTSASILSQRTAPQLTSANPLRKSKRGS